MRCSGWPWRWRQHTPLLTVHLLAREQGFVLVSCSPLLRALLALVMPSARAAARRVLFFQFLSGTSRAAGLGDAVRTLLCLQHVCVRASTICFAGCSPLLRVLLALALYMCVMLATRLRVCEQLFPAPLLRERAGFVTVRHARHICVCVGNYFQLCPSTGWRWRSSGVPCSPHNRVCEQLFPASLLRPRAGLGALRVRHARYSSFCVWASKRF